MYFQNRTPNPWECLKLPNLPWTFQRGGTKTWYTRLRRKVRATPVKMTGSGDTHSRLGPDDSVPVGVGEVWVGSRNRMTDRIRESLTEGTERRREATAQLWILLLNSGTLLGIKWKTGRLESCETDSLLWFLLSLITWTLSHYFKEAG